MFNLFEKKSNNDFYPKRVRIDPNWHLIMQDYWGFEEKAAMELCQKLYSEKTKLKAANPMGYEPYIDGIQFTILAHGEYPDETLIFNDNWKGFRSEVDFITSVEEIKMEANKITQGLGKGLGFHPSFWIRWSACGYDIGVTTSESEKKVVMSGDRQDWVKITTIPYAQCGILGKPWRRNDKFDFNVPPEQQLKESGWEMDKIDMSSNLHRYPNVIHHKYCIVSILGI